MARQHNWSDDYWLLLIQLYLRKPVGLKPKYSRAMVELGIELHIHPDVLYGKMRLISGLKTPRIERLWQTYAGSPRRLSRAVSLLRSMNGFNSAGEFYDGVSTNDTFERDFRPVADDARFTPVMLILVLDLYFRLTPPTMVAETPEVVELARMMGVRPQEVAGVMSVYRHCDPYLCHPLADGVPACLLPACRSVWQRFGNSSPETLAAFAGELMEYFR